MEHLPQRSLQTVITAVAIDAGVVSKTLRVIAKTQLLVCLVEVAVGNEQLRFAIALEAAPRYDIEHRVGTVTVFGRVTAALDFEVIDVFRIELRSNRVSDVGVGNGNPINEPRNLVTTANVQLIVRDYRAGNVVGDHREAVSATRAWRLRDLFAID